MKRSTYQGISNKARFYIYNTALIVVLLFNYTHGVSGKKFEAEVPISISSDLQVVKHRSYYSNPCWLDSSRAYNSSEFLSLYYPIMFADKRDKAEPTSGYELIPLDKEIKSKRRRSMVWDQSSIN
jgi:hypothetical protein